MFVCNTRGNCKKPSAALEPTRQRFTLSRLYTLQNPTFQPNFEFGSLLGERTQMPTWHPKRIFTRAARAAESRSQCLSSSHAKCAAGGLYPPLRSAPTLILGSNLYVAQLQIVGPLALLLKNGEGPLSFRGLEQATRRLLFYTL